MKPLAPSVHGTGWGKSWTQDLQGLVHLLEGLLSLLEKVQDQGLGELALSFILVHLEDLGEGLHIDMLAEVGQSRIILNKLPPDS